MIGGTLSANGLQLTLFADRDAATLHVMPIDDSTPEEHRDRQADARDRHRLHASSRRRARPASIVDDDIASVISVTATDNAGSEQPGDTLVFAVARDISTTRARSSSR